MLYHTGSICEYAKIFYRKPIKFSLTGVKERHIKPTQRTTQLCPYRKLACAEVAELVDALGSGSSRGILVGVRVSPSAPK
jgi:hypothetical protein